MNKVALITGMGMDSRTLAHFLLSKNYTVILTHRRNSLLDIQSVLDLYQEDLTKHTESKLDTSFLDNLDQNSIFNTIKNILQKYRKLNEVYHLSAQSHVFDSFKNPLYSITCNSLSAFYILESLRELKSIKTRFYFANTSECFGGDPKNCPFDENSKIELRSPYSLGKNLGANITDYFKETYGMFACYGWLFNHSNYYRHESFYCAKVVKAAVKIILGKQKNLILGNINHWRDEHFSDFGCEAMWLMLNKEIPNNYVIGNGLSNHGEDYLNQSFQYFNLNWLKYVKLDKSFERPNEVVKLVASPLKAIKELRWKPNRIQFKDHIGLMCKYFYELESGQTPIRPNVFELFP